MTLHRLLRAFVILSLLAVLGGCGKPVPLTSETARQATRVVATADNGYSLTMQQLFDKISASRDYPQGGVMPISEVSRFLDQMLIDTLAGFYADSIDLDSEYDYLRTARQRFYDFLMVQYADARIRDQVTVDSQQVVDFYDDNQALLTLPRRVRIYHIMASWSGLAHGKDSLQYRAAPPDRREDEVRKYIYHVEDLLKGGMPFPEAAAAYSNDDRAAVDSGYLGWVKEGTYEPPFDSLAFSMSIGSFSEPYKTANGWHIINVVERDTGGVAPLNENLYTQIREHLIAQESEKLAGPLIDSLESEINLEYNEPVLDTNIYLVERQTWAAILNGRDTIDFNDLRSLEERYRSRYNVDNTTLDMKKQMVRDVARRLIIIQAARAAGIDTLAVSRQKRASLRHQYAKAVALLPMAPTQWSPPDSLVEAYYNREMANYDIPKPLKVQQIITEDSTFGIFLRDQALSGVDFLELAREYYPGEESIRESLADLGWIGPDDVSPEFYAVARALPIGGVSYPVKTQYGYHVIKLLERKEKRSLSQARAEIVPLLKKEHDQAIHDKYRDKLYRLYNVRFPGRLQPILLKPALERRQETETAAAAENEAAGEPDTNSAEEETP